MMFTRPSGAKHQRRIKRVTKPVAGCPILVTLGFGVTGWDSILAVEKSKGPTLRQRTPEGWGNRYSGSDYVAVERCSTEREGYPPHVSQANDGRRTTYDVRRPS